MEEQIRNAQRFEETSADRGRGKEEIQVKSFCPKQERTQAEDCEWHTNREGKHGRRVPDSTCHRNGAAVICHGGAWGAWKSARLPTSTQRPLLGALRGSEAYLERPPLHLARGGKVIEREGVLAGRGLLRPVALSFQVQARHGSDPMRSSKRHLGTPLASGVSSRQHAQAQFDLLPSRWIILLYITSSASVNIPIKKFIHQLLLCTLISSRNF